MLIDEVEVSFKGGHGGRGITSFGKKEHSGPDGGNGGRGGDLYIITSSDITLLNQFSRKQDFSADDGNPGERNRRTGKNGKDLEILLPIGTSIVDIETKETLYELNKVDERILMCKGGLGGLGNWEFRGPKNITPSHSQPGLEGDIKKVKLILKLIADFGLVGLPNAGKSSLLNEVTNAKAKIANYPFTTISPNLGVYKGKYLADIPGLIEGASSGKGLGIGFLKHIEKVGVIFHCISSESQNLLGDYATVRNEMKKYNSILLKKKEIILLTKTDLLEENEKRKYLSKLGKKSKQVLEVSIYNYESIENIRKIISKK
jgi:GTPase